jgi:hypothetical protein
MATEKVWGPDGVPVEVEVEEPSGEPMVWGPDGRPVPAGPDTVEAPTDDQPE